MGKYMRKSKVAGEVAVMELAQSSLGVRTRAKTLALQRLNAAAAAAAAATNSGTSYLQLRSRRLEKPPMYVRTTNNNPDSKKQPQPRVTCSKESPNNPNPNLPTTTSRLAVSSVNSPSVGSVTRSSSRKKEEAKASVGFADKDQAEANCDDVGIEASFGENVLETEGRERSTRESTPCSLIRESNNTESPVSSTRAPSSTATNRRRIQNTTVRRNIPTSNEMDEFFAGAEEEQQRVFTEKYNFDPVNDTPLPGRYEWVRIDP